jgi:hypothetical protein
VFVFPIERDEDGWLPYKVEVVWADRTESADEVLLAGSPVSSPQLRMVPAVRSGAPSR